MTPTDQVLLTNDTRNWISLDVTADVSAWLADTANHGWHIAKPANIANNGRIVFWSRENSQFRPRLVLFASQDTIYRLVSVVEPGVQATISPSDTVLSAGRVVTYAFSAGPGYENLQVTLDDQAAAPSDSFTMSKDRLLVASADRIVAVSVADSALAQNARAVLFSSNPVAAYQGYLNQVKTVMASTSPEEAEERLDAIQFIAYDPIEDSTALRQTDNALANHVFTLSPREAGDTTAEATTFVYVNGINSDPDEAGRAYGRLDSILQADTLFRKKAFHKVLYYNRTYDAEADETLEERVARCRDLLSKRKKFIGLHSQTTFMLRCIGQSTPTWDWAEAFQQWLNVRTNSPVRQVDAIALADTLQSYRTQGRHSIVVGHSQGVMMAKEALEELRGTYGFSEEQDSTCVAVMTLAPPISPTWGGHPENRLRGVRLLGDPIAALGNGFPVMSNDSSTKWLAEIAALPSGALEAWIFAKVKYDLFMEIHKARTYLIPSQTKAAIAAGLDTLYHDCAASFVSFNWSGKAHPVGEVWQLLNPEVRNRPFERLNGRRFTAWASSNPGVATVDSTGTVQALSAGSVTISLRSGAVRRKADLDIHEPSPFPPFVYVFGTWERTVSDGNGGTCIETLSISLGATVTRVCGNPDWNSTLRFGDITNPPWIASRLVPIPPESWRWIVELAGTGNTLNASFLTSPSDPTPEQFGTYTRR